jgi:hypothetical protein
MFRFIFAIFAILISLAASTTVLAALPPSVPVVPNSPIAHFNDLHREVAEFMRPGVFYSQSRNCAVRVEEQEAAGSISDGLVRVTETLNTEPALVFKVLQLNPAKELASVAITPATAAEIIRTDFGTHQALLLKGKNGTEKFEVSLLARKSSQNLMRMNVKAGTKVGYCY